MMAAGRAAEMGAHVTLLERTGTLGKKLLISGKTRCNLTNARDLDQFISMYGPNGRFLYGAFHRFFRDDLISFLGRYGVGTKIERGGGSFRFLTVLRMLSVHSRNILQTTVWRF